ncbi:hypothetical protein Tco_0425042 [Tanacetum coccineum]
MVWLVRLEELEVPSKSSMLKDQMLVYIDKSIVEDVKLIKKLKRVFSDLTKKELKKMMIEEYYPRNELQKIETELWNLTVKGIIIIGYTKHFQELALLFPGMVTPEYKKVECYIWGLMLETQGNVTSLKPTKIQEEIRMAHDLMDQVVRAKVAMDVDNKRK